MNGTIVVSGEMHLEHTLPKGTPSGAPKNISKIFANANACWNGKHSCEVEEYDGFPDGRKVFFEGEGKLLEEVDTDRFISFFTNLIKFFKKARYTTHVLDVTVNYDGGSFKLALNEDKEVIVI